MSKPSDPMKAIAKRLAEPSTWAGLAAIFAAVAPFLGASPEHVAAAAAAAGGVAVVLRDPGHRDP